MVYIDVNCVFCSCFCFATPLPSYSLRAPYMHSRTVITLPLKRLPQRIYAYNIHTLHTCISAWDRDITYTELGIATLLRTIFSFANGIAIETHGKYGWRIDDFPILSKQGGVLIHNTALHVFVYNTYLYSTFHFQPFFPFLSTFSNKEAPSQRCWLIVRCRLIVRCIPV